MALKPCRECGAEVSTDAETCPHCGVRSPVAKGSGKGSGIGRAIVILTILLIIGWAISTTNKPESGSTKPQEDPQISQCRSDWTKCADNAQLANNSWDYTVAEGRCKTAANDQAKYGTPKWPWLAFSSFRKGTDYVTSGIAVLVEPDAQFQNGFGAMVHSRVVCTYDLRAKRVIDVVISER
jgi:hypothetical protein